MKFCVLVVIRVLNVSVLIRQTADIMRASFFLGGGGVAAAHMEAPCQDAREIVENGHFVDIEQGLLAVINVHVAKKYAKGEVP